ncbi:flavodoxin domain-containing protein [Aliidiomarina sp.]|uniref:flavodoxin domain-containing protein n=1 Tax=Aliidiomarina sp. TaxID=1872439 RepID=UPI003A4D8C1B
MHFHILVGTTSGNTEYLADALSERLAYLGHTTTLHDQPELAEVPTDNAANWLLCMATHGAGEYAESIIGFMEALTTTQPNLSAVKVAIVAIGDSSYDTFCKAGIDAEAIILELNAQLIAPTLTIDMFNELDPEANAISWLNQWIATYT